MKHKIYIFAFIISLVAVSLFIGVRTTQADHIGGNPGCIVGDLTDGTCCVHSVNPPDGEACEEPACNNNCYLYCGDGGCGYNDSFNGWEDCNNCPQDCGACATHTECQNGQCNVVGGVGSNSCWPVGPAAPECQGGGGFSCSPGSQSVVTGGTASLQASGGSGAYTWSAPGGVPSSGNGSNFSTSYTTLGTKTITLSDDNGSTNCSVSVTPGCNTAFPSNKFHVCYFDGKSAPTTAAPILSQTDYATSVPSPVGSYTAVDHNWPNQICDVDADGDGDIDYQEVCGTEVDSSGKWDTVSAVWRGNINFQDGSYVFHTLSDDGVELIILNSDGTNPQTVITNWGDHGSTQNNSPSVPLTGPHRVQLRWYENGGDAVVKLWWTYTPLLSIANVTISTNADVVILPGGSVVVDGATQYKIRVIASHPSGAGFVSDSKARINYQGEKAGMERGYLTWNRYNFSDGSFWSGFPDRQSCGGTSVAAIQPGTNTYVQLVSCSFSDVGNVNTVTFTVKFKPAYTAPVIDNDISGYIYDSTNNAVSDWTNFNTDFNLYLAPPTITSINNSTCTKLNVFWTDNSSLETGYRVYRATTSGGFYTNVSGDMAANSASYLDTPPSTSTTYYYVVRAFVTEGSTSFESANSNEASAVNQFCTATFSNSKKEVWKVNGVVYDGKTPIRNGDIITYKITIRNDGPAAATVNYVCEYPSANLINLTNLQVDKGSGYVAGTITANSPVCNNKYRLNISGAINASVSWLATVDATVSTSSSNQQELSNNTDVINYSVGGSTFNTTSTVNTILNEALGSPDFKEIAP